MVALDRSPYMKECFLIEGIIHRIGVATAASWYAFPKRPVNLVFSVLRLTCVQHSAMRSHPNPSLQLLCLPHLNNERTKTSDFAAWSENLDAVVQIPRSILCLNSYTQMAIVTPLVFGGGNLLEYYFKITFNPLILLSVCCEQRNSWLSKCCVALCVCCPGTRWCCWMRSQTGARKVQHRKPGLAPRGRWGWGHGGCCREGQPELGRLKQSYMEGQRD